MDTQTTSNTIRAKTDIALWLTGRDYACQVKVRPGMLYSSDPKTIKPTLNPNIFCVVGDFNGIALAIFHDV